LVDVHENSIFRAQNPGGQKSPLTDSLGLLRGIWRKTINQGTRVLDFLKIVQKSKNASVRWRWRGAGHSDSPVSGKPFGIQFSKSALARSRGDYT
jgi:hypothetical protein